MASTASKYLGEIAPIQILSVAGACVARLVCACCNSKTEKKYDHAWPDGQKLRRFFTNLGWRLSTRAVCPICESKSRRQKSTLPHTKDMRMVSIPSSVINISSASAPPTDAAKEQRRMAYTAIEAAYDEVKKRYYIGNTDATIAEEVGCAVALVAKVRDEFFGVNGPPDEVELIKLDIIALQRENSTLIERLSKNEARLNALCKKHGWSS